METHEKIMSAIKALAGYHPLEVEIPFRGGDVICMDAYGIQAYKVGNFFPLTVQWEELTPIEALIIKRACRYHLHLILQEENEWSREIKELFRATPFGC